jgi:hypothetical protein
LDRQTFSELVLRLIACRKFIAASAVTSMPEYRCLRHRITKAISIALFPAAAT